MKMLPSFCKDEVEISRAPLVDRRGTKVRDWDNAVTHKLTGCSLQDVSTDTAWTYVRQGVTLRAVLYAPPGSDIMEGDRVSFDGRQFSVDGSPMPRRSPTGRVSHVECNLTDWSG